MGKFFFSGVEWPHLPSPRPPPIPPHPSGTPSRSLRVRERKKMRKKMWKKNYFRGGLLPPPHLPPSPPSGGAPSGPLCLGFRPRPSAYFELAALRPVQSRVPRDGWPSPPLTLADPSGTPLGSLCVRGQKRMKSGKKNEKQNLEKQNFRAGWPPPLGGAPSGPFGLGLRPSSGLRPVQSRVSRVPRYKWHTDRQF